MHGLEEFIDPYDNGILWYPIPGFRGYEYNFTLKSIRSLKNLSRFPYGCLLKSTNNKEYTLTDNNNCRVKISINDIEKIIKNNPAVIPVYTYQVNYFNRRNSRAFIKPDEAPKHGKLINKPKPVRKEPISDFGFEFSTID